MSNHNKAFGKALRTFRKSANQTQEILAFDADLDRTYISLLELGEASPTLDTTIALCKALNITLVEFAVAIEKWMAELNE